MQLYQVTPWEGSQPGWHRTLSEAHADAKLAFKGSSAGRDVRIRLYDYPADQQVVCDLFNGIRPDGTLKRVWRLTPRGGLFELSLDGTEPEDDHPPFAERMLDYEGPHIQQEKSDERATGSAVGPDVDPVRGRRSESRQVPSAKEFWDNLERTRKGKT